MKLGSVDQIPELFVCTHNLSKIVSILEVDCTDPRVSISVVKDQVFCFFMRLYLKSFFHLRI